MREIVLDTLLTLERGESYSHMLVKAVLDKYDYLEARDKAFFKRLTEGTQERRLELDYYLDYFSSVPVKKMKPLIRCLLRMSVYQLLYMDNVPDSAVCNEACKLAAKRGFCGLRGFVNGILRTIAKEREKLPLPDEEEALAYLSVKYSMPEWITGEWLEDYGRDITERLLRALLDIHPVCLRMSSRAAREEREAVCGRIREKGVGITQSPYLPYLYILGHTEGPAALPGFAEGKFIVQDVSSALAVEAALIREGDFVIDVCASPGGKSLLAAEKAGTGRVLSRDISEEKVERIAENVLRMRAENIETEIFDGSGTDERLAGRADVVLLDVPCSGLGVVGKKRDIKYRLQADSCRDIEMLQRQIVRASAGYVKPGGILLYSTCTIRREENEDMVRFIVGELGFTPMPLEGILPRRVFEERDRLEEDMRRAGREPGKGLTEAEKKACIQILPGYMKADGFFIARFRRAEETDG